jgi:hypothetical protein
MNLTAADGAFLAQLPKTGIDGYLLIQEYESANSYSEYSLIFINSEHTHAFMEVPTVRQFRC